LLLSKTRIFGETGIKDFGIFGEIGIKDFGIFGEIGIKSPTPRQGHG